MHTMTPVDDLEKTTTAREHGLQVESVSYTLPSGLKIIHDVSLDVKPGQLCAIMGPSGAGKTTALDLFAKRGLKGVIEGSVRWDGREDWSPVRKASYSEQTDDLLGVLTVKETFSFAARLSHPPGFPRSELDDIVKRTIANLGLDHIAESKIGTPISRGISGGQKRRVTLGTSLVSGRKLLFLDEPTSGLDSTSSREVIAALQRLARQEGVAVIASIHQPSFETLSLFDQLLVLARGKTVFYGPVDQLTWYVAELGHPVQGASASCMWHTSSTARTAHHNPADIMLDLASFDFASSSSTDHKLTLDDLVARWKTKHASQQTSGTLSHHDHSVKARKTGLGYRIRALLHSTLILSHRNIVNYSRNLLAYGIRFGMFIGMGLMLGLIWLRLPKIDTYVQDRLSVSFYSVAFLAFMSVAGIPSFLEERSVFMRERNNGLYSSAAYALANTLTSLPFLFACNLVFLLIAYWAVGLNTNGAAPFFRFLAYGFLALVAAESQSVLIAAAVPIFVAALAIAAFVNGFWMSVGGYFIRIDHLPGFWRAWAQWINYHKYSFALLVDSDLRSQTFACIGSIATGDCFCAYPSSLVAQGQCAVSGSDVLEAIGIGTFSHGLYIGVLLAIIVVFRLAFWLALAMRRH